MESQWIPLLPQNVPIASTPTIEPQHVFSSDQSEHDEEGTTYCTSINWKEFSYPNDTTHAHSAYSMTSAHKCGHASPFILDSEASCHISPVRDDFETMTPTRPHPISGFGGSCVYAVGVGTMQLRTSTGTRMKLSRVLFVPNATVRLISVCSINNDGQNACYFDDKSCIIIDKAGNAVLTGTAWRQRRLYILNCMANTVNQAKSESSIETTDSSAFYATRTPDLETWHRRLGHCNNRTIIDMARGNVVEGMPIDLSSAPAACYHCILGKQTRTHVPKSPEGRKATKRLERVFVDLCGPMPNVSRHGHLYSMNVIDDFSSYVWSLPLARKSEAINTLRAWHRAVENQSGEKLKIIVTDNGELVSNTMTAWCSLHGIDHQLNAPHTSAHNGRAERLHRTVLGKARAMRLSCNATADLWDEFCATSAYLTNYTASSSLDGKTPHELWFGHKPSLSHLREIGCRAFALIQANNPTIFQRSTPCILIGYAPRSKAYRLWDTTTGRISNSFHVTFVEHLQSQPVDLLPGTTIHLNPDAPPTWACLPNPPPQPLQAPQRPTNDPVLPTFPPFIPT